jgi:7 transmembrane receptor (rhodopsin family)
MTQLEAWMNCSVSNLSRSQNSTKFLAQIRGPDWHFITIYNLTVAILSFMANGTVMMTFLLKSSLRKPFNVYLINLVTANFLFACMASPVSLLNNLFSGWWLSQTYCSVGLYSQRILEAAVRMSHALITINRIWAIFWPFSYRVNHSGKTACLVCLAGLSYILVNLLPGLILDSMYYRPPLLINKCEFNGRAQWSFVLATQFSVYNLTTLVVVGSYPIIW